jgi:hypothetical protein
VSIKEFCDHRTNGKSVTFQITSDDALSLEMDLTHDTVSYICTFLYKSSIKSLSLTCIRYSTLFPIKGDAAILCCKYDDVQLFNKLVANPVNSHLRAALNHGSFHLFKQLNEKDYTEDSLLFDKYLKIFIKIDPVAHEQNVRKDPEIKADFINWYEQRKLTFVCNIMLVIKRQRQAFYCDLFDSSELVKELLSHGIAFREKGVYGSATGNTILYLSLDGIFEINKYMNNGTLTHSDFGKMFGYAYTGRTMG